MRFTSIALTATLQVMSRNADARRSECPVATTLDLLGDKWTLLVVRDLLDGKHRFRDFEGSPESIPTNILTERLRRLVDAGLAEQVPIPGSKRRAYAPTDAARALRPTLVELARWGNTHLDDTWTPPDDWLLPEAT